MATNFNPLQLALKPLLEKAILEDELFAQEVINKKDKKNFEECCEYIMGEAYEYAKEHKSGNFGLAGMSGDDLIGMIKHYWDEDDIEVKKMNGAKASVTTTGTSDAPKPVSEVKKANKTSKKADDGSFDMFGDSSLWED